MMVYRRPPFTGIHETLPRRGEGAPNEGGGDIPPFGEDIINKIVDVNFGGDGVGGVFASGDLCCFFRYASVGYTDDQDWIGLGSLGFGDSGVIRCSSYGVPNGRPTFLMGGDGFPASVMVSHDGIHWTVSRTSEESRVHNLIWDAEEGIFYAQTSGYIRSRDGYVWEYVIMTDDDFWAKSQTGFSDGEVGYDAENGVMIFPWDLEFMAAYCTAFLGGVWMAGGYELDEGRSATATSLDGGETWTFVSVGAIGMHADYEVVTMVGAPHTDF